jgi:hypothetical protein
MKKQTCCFISALSLALLLLMGVAYADTDLLNLSAYSKGAALPYGENVVVGQDVKTGVKWVTAGAEKKVGKMKFPINLSGDFDLVIKIGSYSTGQTLFLTADEYQIMLKFWASSGPALYVKEGYATDKSNAWNSRDTNVIKLSVKSNVAKIYVNDVFSLKVTLTPNLTYTQLLFNDISNGQPPYYPEDQLLKLTLSGNSTQPPGGVAQLLGSNDFEAGKQAGIQAGIQQCVANPSSCGITVTTATGNSASGKHASYNPRTGELYIPLMDVPGALGGIQTYEVYLKQRSLTFTFDLDMGRVVLK